MHQYVISFCVISYASLLTIPKQAYNINLDTFQLLHSSQGVLVLGPPTLCLSSLWSCKLMHGLFLTAPKVYLVFPANLYFAQPCWGLVVWMKVWGRVVYSTATRSFHLGVLRRGIVGKFLSLYWLSCFYLDTQFCVIIYVLSLCYFVFSSFS